MRSRQRAAALRPPPAVGPQLPPPPPPPPPPRRRRRATSGRGSALYLDNIRLGSRITGLAADARATGARLSIYPNPSAEGEALIRLATGTTGAATLRITDATGRRLGQPLTIGMTGADTERELSLRSLAGPLAAGVYVVELTTADGARLTQRALVY